MDGFTLFRRLPRNSLYTKPFKSKRSLLLGFLLLVCLRKRAFDTASKQKTRHSMTGFAERKGFEPSIRLPAYTLSRRAPSTTRTPLFFIYFSFICSSILSLYSNGSFFQFLLYFTNIAIQIDLDKRINMGCNNITNAIEPNIQ